MAAKTNHTYSRRLASQNRAKTRPCKRCGETVYFRPTAEMLYRVAAALGCRMETLMGSRFLEGDGTGDEPNHLHELADLRKRLKQIERMAGGADAP